MPDNKTKKRVIILDGKKKHNDEAGSESEIKELEAFGEEVFGEDFLKELASIDNAGKEDDNEDYSDVGETVTGHRRGRSSRKTGMSKKSKHLLILTVSTVILVLLAVGAVRTVNNNYQTPIKIYEEYLNKPEYTGEELSEALGNHVADKQLRHLRDILGRSDDYRASLDASLQKSRKVYENNCENYGDDFRFTVSVDGMKKLDSIQVSALRTELNGILGDINTSSLAGSDDPELTQAVKDVIAALEKPGVTAGYRVYCTQRVTGSREADPENGMHDYQIFTVVKLDGRWIMWDKIYDILKVAY